ncbi:MAG: hypothetical protein IJE81_00340 [Oscillospiraceae bacterium]|nr:hypothetical protein [Oscillospiraceae bacterium]
MIQAFRKSKLGFYGMLALSMGIAAAVWAQDQNYPIFVPIIATVLTLAIGSIAALLMGNILAASENTRLLGYLHMELDPKKFIQGYQAVPDKMKGENNIAISRSYLADGYAAAGDYETAISLLTDPPADNLAVQGLYAANRAGFYLALQDTDKAAASLARLEGIIDACRLKKADLAANLTEMRNLHRHHLACLTGKQVDTDSLETAFARAQYNLRRLEIKKVLAMTAIRDGDENAAKEHLSYLRKNGGLTVYKHWADSRT